MGMVAKIWTASTSNHKTVNSRLLWKGAVAIAAAPFLFKMDIAYAIQSASLHDYTNCQNGLALLLLGIRLNSCKMTQYSKGINMSQFQTHPNFLPIIEQTLAATVEGITIADAQQPDFPLVYVNQAFCDITGYTSDSVLGSNCRFLQGPDTDPNAIEKIRDLIKTQQKGIVELINYRQDGTPFWNRLSLVPIFLSSDTLGYYVGIQSDITQIKMAQSTEERFKGMKTTLMTVNDIVVNFLYSLQRYRLMMEEPTPMTDRALAEFDQLYENTLNRINHLNKLDTYKEKTLFPNIKILDES